MFSAVEDDDDFSVSGAASSKLASLFNADGGGSQSDKQSFTYNAPKQPQKPKSAASASQSTSGKQSQSQMNILHAVAVHTFKYDGSKHINEGKLGLAIIGNHQSLTYRLLLYKGQKQHVAFATISPTFTFVIQANNYANFYDDTRQNWSINFDTSQAITEFAKQVCMAKANTSKASSMKSPLSQDLALGEGDVLDVGDVVEIKYTGWFFTNNTFGTMFESNETSKKALRFRIGKGKQIKGLEDGVIGMKKNGRKLIVIPPCCGYASVEKAEASLKTNVLIYEVEMVKCRFTKDSASTHSSTPDQTDFETDRKTDSPSRSHSSSLAEDSSIRARCASLSEQLTQSPNKKKATIISRIVKMGQPMLPLQGAAVAQPSSESENEEELAAAIISEPVAISGEATNKPIPKPRPQQAVSNSNQQTTTFDTQPVTSTVAQSMNVFPSTQLLPHSLPLAANPSFSLLPQSSFSQAVQSPIFVGGGDGHLSLLLTENRTQNTELRMHMAKLAEKLDLVLTKVDNRAAENAMALPSMDSRTLSQNVQRICRENESLQTDVKDKNAKIEAQNEKICDLLQKNQKYIEQSTNLLEQRNNSMQTNASQLNSKFESLENENRKLLRELKEARDQLCVAQEQVQHSEEKLNRMAMEKDGAIQNYQKLGEDISQFENRKTEWEKEKQEMHDRIEALENTKAAVETDKMVEDVRREYEDQLARLNEQIKQLKTKSPSNATPNIANELKKIMNAVFKHLQSEFKVEENYTGAYVNEQLKQKIIHITLQLTQKYSQKLDDSTDGLGATSADVVDDDKPAEEKSVDFENKIASSISESTQDDECVEPSENQSIPALEEKQMVEVTPADDDAKKLELPGDHISDTSEEYEPWKPQPPPPPTFIEEAEDEDDWLK